MPIWIVFMQGLSRAVLGVLILLSIGSVATMIRCARTLRTAEGPPAPKNQLQSELSQALHWIQSRDWKALKDWADLGKSLNQTVVSLLLKQQEADATQIDRSIKSFLTIERTQLENGLTILATLGSNAPFIGLFGTVLGIIQAFGALGAHQNNTPDIMVGISEALIATAVGLVVAIPAVVAFNLFSRKLKVLLVHAEALKDEYLASRKGGHS